MRKVSWSIDIDAATLKAIKSLAAKEKTIVQELVQSLFTVEAEKRESMKHETVVVPEGKAAVFIPKKAYSNIGRIADMMNQDKWSGRDNTPQSVFESFLFEMDLEDNPGSVLDSISEGMDFYPERFKKNTKEYRAWLKATSDDDEFASSPKIKKIEKRRKAAFMRRAASIKWE
jgi:hypothetical protein